MKNNKKLNPRGNIQRNNEPHYTLTPFSFDRTQQVTWRPTTQPLNTNYYANSTQKIPVTQSNVAAYQNSPLIPQEMRHQAQYVHPTQSTIMPINGAHQSDHTGLNINTNNPFLSHQYSQIYQHPHQNQYDIQNCEYYSDEDYSTQNLISMMSNLANSIYETAKNVNQSGSSVKRYRQYQPRLKQTRRKHKCASPIKTEPFAIQLISDDAKMACNQRKRQFRNQYSVNFKIQAFRSDNMELHSQKQGRFNAGFIDPHLPRTINVITQNISRFYRGSINHIVETVLINDAKWEVDIKITCIVPPIQLPPELQCTYITLDQGIAKGFRIEQGNIQIKWDRDIDISTVDFQEDILIHGYEVQLAHKLRKCVHIIFRSMQLQDKNEKGFLAFVRKNSPGLPLNKLASVMYDQIFNVGVISF